MDLVEDMKVYIDLFKYDVFFFHCHSDHVVILWCATIEHFVTNSGMLGSIFKVNNSKPQNKSWHDVN